MKYLVSLDYDHIPESEVRAEAAKLRRMFKIGLEIWKSSKNSYHIHAKRPMDWRQAKKLLDASNCSTTYKGLCLRLMSFPVRTGEKLIFDENRNISQIKPAPIALAQSP
jgi:hypothetical protein